MRISRITVWQKSLPLVEPYQLSGGRLAFESLDSTFVRIDTDEGLAGWGEGCPWGHSYLPAFGAGARFAIALLAPVLQGRSPVTAALALSLEAQGWSNAEFWLRCQAHYDLAQERLRRDRAA